MSITSNNRRHDLDALRACAMLLGIVLHAAISFSTYGWAINDTHQSEFFDWLFMCIHGFRMQLFFLISGFFTAMLLQKRGLKALLIHRVKRIFLPFLLFTPIIVYLTAEILKYGRLVQGSTIHTKPYTEIFSSFPNFVEYYNLHHLWFLWFLCIYIGISSLLYPLKKLALKIPTKWVEAPSCLLWLIPLTLLPQTEMTRAYTMFGPDTSLSILPSASVLCYYAIFYFFGGIVYRHGDQLITKHYKCYGWLAFLLLLPLGITIEWNFANVVSSLFGYQQHLVSDIFQVSYSWLAVFWCMGFCKRYMSKPSTNFRYLSDASYWLYLTHLPLVFALQLWIADWNFPLIFKFTFVNLATFGLLLLLYHYLVRGKWIGKLLNGK